MLSLLLSQQIIQAPRLKYFRNHCPSMNAANLQVLRILLASRFSCWPLSLHGFHRTSSSVLHHLRLRPAGTSYLIYQPQLFFLQCIRPEKSENVIFCSLWIHWFAHRNVLSTSLCQELSCRHKGEWLGQLPFLLRGLQLLLSSQPALWLCLHISQHRLSALLITHCPHFGHYSLCALSCAMLPKTSSFFNPHI